MPYNDATMRYENTTMQYKNATMRYKHSAESKKTLQETKHHRITNKAIPDTFATKPHSYLQANPWDCLQSSDKAVCKVAADT